MVTTNSEINVVTAAALKPYLGSKKKFKTILIIPAIRVDIKA